MRLYQLKVISILEFFVFMVFFSNYKGKVLMVALHMMVERYQLKQCFLNAMKIYLD